MTDKTIFTKREWIHLIITLSIIQAIIWFISFQFAANSTALGYVSFAGTIISIILAVLAIGYTYGESQQQKNASGTLSNQIDELVKIKDKLEMQTLALDEIKTVKDHMLNLSSQVDRHFKENQVKIDLVSSNVSVLAQNISSPVVMQTSIANYFQAAKTYNNTFHFLYFAIMALFLDREFKKDSHSTFEELFKVIDELDIDYNEIFSSKDYIIGGCTVTINTLNLSGTFNYEKKYINPDLLEFFKYSANSLNNIYCGEPIKNKFNCIKDAVLNLDILKTN